MIGQEKLSSDPARPERLPSLSENRETPEIQMGIYDENTRLTTATVWGAIGAEAQLAQLYPKEKSLFFDDFDVIKARQESLAFMDKLRSHGVHVISVKERFAHLLDDCDNNSPEELVTALVRRGESIKRSVADTFEFDRRQGEKRPEELEETRIKIESYPTENQLRQVIRDIVDMDIMLLGKKRAIRLNEELCLETDMPLGNMYFARDQMNVALDKRIVSRMKKAIRREEVQIYERVYRSMGLANGNAIVLPDDDAFTFEGGDLYVHDGNVYCGVGPRTSIQAAKFIFEKLAPDLYKRKMNFFIVQDPDPEHRTSEDLMDFMHLDTFSGVAGHKKMVVCEDEAKRRQVSLLVARKSGKIEVVGTGLDYKEFLIQLGDDVKVIPRAEQQTFGCNYLCIDDKLALLPLDINDNLEKHLDDAGMGVEFCGLNQCTKGYGAAHCMVGQLRRG
jgi:arginine deiminase